VQLINPFGAGVAIIGLAILGPPYLAIIAIAATRDYFVKRAYHRAMRRLQ
jgi:hypothetical protein